MKAIYNVHVKCEAHDGEVSHFTGLATDAKKAIDKALSVEPRCAVNKDCKFYISSLECLGEPDF